MWEGNVVYYESIQRELKMKPIYAVEGPCFGVFVVYYESMKRKLI
jgi:hypothetical protein